MTNYPDTAEKQRAGMAAVRARMLAAHERALANGWVKGRDAETTRCMIATIRATQQRKGA